MEEFVPYDIPGERERSRSRKNKLIVVEDYDNGDVDRLEYPSDELFCNFLDGQGLHLVTEALKANSTKARTALFKAEVVEKELARLKEEAAANSLPEKELARKEARRTYRKGKR
ncbi:hypothetical protein Bca52824_058349 [Brassica carinata]|uniref:Uncharacterized protein n=1 Tax=Brassica carinata TaxID=52824 RepID=A0A8X7QSB1_BRACI|nr:hypothetical protein Bca52824_058349 [Brassica carinata]